MNNSKEDAPTLQTEFSVRVVDREIDSRDLFRFARELVIRHEGSLYRLRLTSQNKLILTK